MKFTKPKPTYHIRYFCDNRQEAVSCSTGKAPDEVLYTFHKYMQNNLQKLPSDYKILEMTKGNHSAHTTYDEAPIMSNPIVETDKGRTTIFK